MNKFSKDKKIIINHYNRKIKKYRNGPKAVGWGNKKSQLIRFQILSEIGDLNNKTILDVGCGTGDLYGFLTKKKKIKIKRYLGIDVNPLMIKRARKKYLEADFEVRDLLKNTIKEPFDYVLESGVFGLKIPHWGKLTYEILIRMFKISKIGMGANFLSDFVPFKKDRSSYFVNPGEILTFACNHLTSKLILRHDYLPHDFTVFFYK